MTTLTFTPPIHPGEILREEFLVPLHLSAGALAKRLSVPRTRIERIVKEETPVTPDTALRLSRALGTTAQFWMNMQAAFDLAQAEAAGEEALRTIQPLEQLAHAS
ncbi:MAG: HigA family addiction module antitoxin [Candidatus Devosia euplotis]|nr:HigA family addiction module antitoxin [Candidatus Devosia euplotis]